MASVKQSKKPKVKEEDEMETDKVHECWAEAKSISNS